MSYDPLSIDAQLSAILTRMDAQDKVMNTILAQCIKTNGRVTMLEEKAKALFELINRKKP